MERLREQWSMIEEDVDDEEDDEAAFARATADDAPFDTQEFWSEDEFMTWHPEPRHSTAAWLATEPTLFEGYARPDRGWRFDYSPAPLIDPTDREAFERDAEALGYQGVRAEALKSLYLGGPSPDVHASLIATVQGEVMAPSVSNNGQPTKHKSHDRAVIVAGGGRGKHAAVCDWPDCTTDFESRSSCSAAAAGAREHRLAVKPRRADGAM